MPNDPPPELWQQVKALQTRVKELETLLAAADRLRTSAEATPVPSEPPASPNAPATPVSVTLPPPVIQAPAMAAAPAPVPAPSLWVLPPEAPPPAPTPEAVERNSETTEITFGRNVFPWLGGILTAFGLTLLTTFLIQRGFITPAMQFGFAIAFCAAFGLVGEWLRSKGNALAPVVAGLASFGSFVTVVGGHTTFKIYSDQVAFYLVLILSVANILYSAWRKWEVFNAGGLAGGMVAGYMAIHTPSVALATVLATGLVAGGVSAWFRWPRTVWLAYLSTVVFTTLNPWFPGITDLPAALAYQLRFALPSALMVAYCLRRGTAEVRPLVVVPAMWVIAAVYLTTSPEKFVGLNPLVMYSIWGVPMALLAWAERKHTETAVALGAAGYLAVSVLQPLSLPEGWRPLAWLGFAAIGAAATYRWRSVLLISMVTSWQVYSVLAWIIQHSYGPEYPVFWIAHLALHAGMLYAYRREAWLATMELGNRLGVYCLGLLPLSLMSTYTTVRLGVPSPSVALTLSLLSTAAAYSLIGLACRNITLRYVGWISWAGLVLKIYAIDFLTMSDEWRIVTLLGSGITALTVAGLYLRKLKQDPPAP